MRQLRSWRTWAAIGAVLLLAAITQLAAGRGPRGSTGGAAAQPTTKHVEVVSSIMSITSTTSWSVVKGLTVGSATLAIDDGRIINIARDTPGELDCTDRTRPAACVLLADVLGGGVVWYAIVNSDSPVTRTLTLPTLVDMVNGGDTGILENGWHVQLANGVVRTCPGEPRSPTLRSFIESYSSTGIRTLLDLDRDEIVEVICKK